MNTPSILTTLQQKLTGKTDATRAQLEADQAKLTADLAHIEAERASIASQLEVKQSEADQATIAAAREATAAALAATEREKQRLSIEREKNRKALRADAEKRLAALIREADAGYAKQGEMAKQMVTMEVHARAIWAQVRTDWTRASMVKREVEQVRAELAALGATDIPEPTHIPTDMTFLGALAAGLKSLSADSLQGVDGRLALGFIFERLRAFRI